MIRFPILWLAMGVLAFIGVSCSKERSVVYHPIPDNEIKMGVLVPMTGAAASEGACMAAAAMLARDDFNAWMEAGGYTTRLTLVIADSRTDTAEALRRVRSFREEGISITIGPYSSDELAHIRAFADSSGMILVSPSSTAGSLARKDDNVLRFMPPDNLQAKAQSKLLAEDKIRVIIPLVRDNLWGNDLLQSTAAEFKKTGGQVHEAVRYAPGLTDFQSVLVQLEQAVSDELQHHTPNDVAVYLLSFAEGTSILNRAGGFTSLNNVYWYGGDAFALQEPALADTSAALFAYSHGFPCPSFALDDNARFKWEPLRDRITGMTGQVPDIHALAMYDAVMVAGRSLRMAASEDDRHLLTLLMHEADGYFGATGSTALDANGDRKSGNFDFYAVKHDSTGYCWKRVARYQASDGRLTRP